MVNVGAMSQVNRDPEKYLELDFRNFIMRFLTCLKGHKHNPIKPQSFLYSDSCHEIEYRIIRTHPLFIFAGLVKKFPVKS